LGLELGFFEFLGLDLGLSPDPNPNLNPMFFWGKTSVGHCKI